MEATIKGWLKTIKDINCNFHAISESWERALAASYFQTLLFRVKTVCHLILIQTFLVSERGNTHQQFEGCNCCSVIKKERWTTRVQSVDLTKKKISSGLSKYEHQHLIHNSTQVCYYYKSTIRASYHYQQYPLLLFLVLLLLFILKEWIVFLLGLVRFKICCTINRHIWL